MHPIIEGRDERGVIMIDHVLILKCLQKEDDSHMKDVLSLLKLAGIKINKWTCICSVFNVEFLVVVTSAGRTSCDSDKFRALLAVEASFDVSEVMIIFDMPDDVGCFLPHLSIIRAPIR